MKKIILSLVLIVALMMPSQAEAKGGKGYCKKHPERCEPPIVSVCEHNPERCKQVMPDYCGGRDGTLNRCKSTEGT